MVALVLICVELGEPRKRLIEAVTRPQIGRDRDAVPGACMSAGECLPGVAAATPAEHLIETWRRPLS